ncbi:HNH endonuclease [Corynebacterium coyleae]|uniref:HNH endonuclease n=1 Tax=Corynebacterium coyleae TaxID=53374 RepID=UPI001CCCD72D|nr:HNH endonuclease signature motif containing protein [Corynebacterium coyleae]UBI10035.1 HNH endonuclease [Corynebacterium coyleae]
MAWSSSDRRKRLPKNWPSLRAKVLSRDKYRCQIRLSGCAGIATDVDHIARGDNHSLDNLRAACSRCHKIKTQAEAQEARRKKRAARFRPEERHPGAR